MRMFAQGALKNAMAKLAELAQGDQRRRGETEFDDEGKPARSVSWGPDDLEAAKTLAKLALDAYKLSRVGIVKQESGQGDLFDAAGKNADPWSLKKPD